MKRSEHLLFRIHPSSFRLHPPAFHPAGPAALFPAAGPAFPRSPKGWCAMKRSWPCAIVIVLLLAGLRPGAIRAQPAPAARDIGAEVRRVFAAKCAGCHGPDLPKPKCRFGYVLDLRRMRENPEIVIPSRPDE